MEIKRLLTEENVGGFDLALRALVGTVAIIALAMDLVPQKWEWFAALAALGGLYTAMTRHCSPYVPFNFSTRKDGCRTDNKKP